MTLNDLQRWNIIFLTMRKRNKWQIVRYCTGWAFRLNFIKFRWKCVGIYIYVYISCKRVNLLQAPTFFITSLHLSVKNHYRQAYPHFSASRNGPGQTLWCWSRIYDNSSDELQGNIVTSHTTSPQVRRPPYDIFNPSKSSCTTSRDITVAR